MNFSEMFATALGVQLNPGESKCFWCGVGCNESLPVGVTDTFWDWDAVACPKSQYQCSGCGEALDEKRVIPGREIKLNKKGKPSYPKTRNFTWLVTPGRATPYTKADIDEIRGVCLDPPRNIEWGLAIAVSGQKHILYRTPVNRSGATLFEVQLEVLRVVYKTEVLRVLIDMCVKIAAANGKPSLNGPIGPMQAIKLPNPQLAAVWNKQWNNPVVRLAAFLCPSKEKAVAYVAEDDN